MQTDECLLLALSSRTGTGREGQQRVGYDPIATPAMNDRCLRTPAIQSGTKRLILITSGPRELRVGGGFVGGRKT